MKKTAFLFSTLLVAAACGGADPTPPNVPSSPGADSGATPTPTATGTGTAHSPGMFDASATTAPPTTAPGAKTKAIAPTEMGAALKDLGLDVRNLPPLNKIPPDKIRKVMGTFTKALGTQCTGCHDGDDFKKATPNKKVAARMWNEFVRGYTMEGGGAVYCDSCHSGKMTFLVRDPGLKELSTWMDDNFVSKLKKTSPPGQAHSCETCHGDPMEGKFLHTWKK